MTDKNLENKIKNAFSNATPDMLDKILSDCENMKGTVNNMSNTNFNSNNTTAYAPKKNNKKWLGFAASLAVVILVGAFGFIYYSNNFIANAIVGIDVNPGLEMQVSKSNKVISLTAMDSDAQKVIGDMDFKGSSLEVATAAIFGSMVQNGYLTDTTNSVLISVESDNAQRAEDIKSTVSASAKTVAEQNNIGVTIASQNVVENNTEVSEIKTNEQISTGKATLINSLLKNNTTYTADALSGLTITQLMLLLNEDENDLDINGNVSNAGFISVEQVIDSALNGAGLLNVTLTEADIDYDYENGKMVYEVEFNTEGTEYDITVDALTGEIIEIKSELESDNGDDDDDNDDLDDLDDNDDDDNDDYDNDDYDDDDYDDDDYDDDDYDDDDYDDDDYDDDDYDDDGDDDDDYDDEDD